MSRRCRIRQRRTVARSVSHLITHTPAQRSPTTPAADHQDLKREATHEASHRLKTSSLVEVHHPSPCRGAFRNTVGASRRLLITH